MAVTNRYKGDCRCGLTAAVGGVEARLRTANDASAMGDKTFEMSAGSSITFYYKRGTQSNAPDGVTIAVNRDNDATVIRTYQTLGAQPADGTSFTFFATSDGTVTGTPRAGVYRLYLRIRLTTGSNTYDVDSDGTFGAFGAGWVLPVGFADSGCLRGNALVTDLAVNAYPAGSTFANGNPGDTITLTATLTQGNGATNTNMRMDVIDSSDVQAFAGSNAADSSTSFAQNFTVSDSFAASSANYGCRLLPISNAAFVPTSGAILWTVPVASGTATQDGNNVKRSSFYAVDPRVTAAHHIQYDDSTFGTAKAGSTTKTAGTIGYVATRLTNARSEGINGLTVTQLLTAPATGVNRSSSTSTATRDSQAGWTDLLVWDAGAPLGTWPKTVDITAPSNIDADTHMVSGSQNYTMAAGNTVVVKRPIID